MARSNVVSTAHWVVIMALRDDAAEVGLGGSEGYSVVSHYCTYEREAVTCTALCLVAVPAVRLGKRRWVLSED